MKQALDFTRNELDVAMMLKRLRVLEGITKEGFDVA
jgi:hypothetical protein